MLVKIMIIKKRQLVYLSFVKVVNNVLVKHFFQLSLSVSTILSLAHEHWIIRPLQNKKKNVKKKT